MQPQSIAAYVMSRTVYQVLGALALHLSRPGVHDYMCSTEVLSHTTYGKNSIVGLWHVSTNV